MTCLKFDKKLLYLHCDKRSQHKKKPIINNNRERLNILILDMLTRDIPTDSAEYISA